MGERIMDPARWWALAGGRIATVAKLRDEHLVLADDGRVLLLLPPDESQPDRERRILAAIGRLYLDGRLTRCPCEPALRRE